MTEKYPPGSATSRSSIRSAPLQRENVSWTYADLANVYLGQMRANGTIIAQSFWRKLDRASARGPE